MKPAIKTLIIFSCVALLCSCINTQQTTRQTLDAINHTLLSVDSALNAADSIKKAAHDILNKVDSIKNHADTAFKWKLSEDTITYTDGCIINNLVMNCPCSDTATYTIGDTIYCTCTTTNNSTTKK